MARTVIAAQTPKGPYVSLQPAANSLDIAMTAADVANGNQTVFSGPLLLVVQNTHASSPFTFTLTSRPDSKLRSGDITTYTLQAGDVVIFKLDATEGWLQDDGNLYYAGSDATIKFALLRL